MFAIYAQHVKVKFVGNPINCDCHLAWLERDNRHLLENIHFKCTNETLMWNLATCWAGRCPFPGLKANSRFRNEAFADRTSFSEREIVSFECLEGFYSIPDEPNFITCQNGSWSASPPRCGIF